MSEKNSEDRKKLLVEALFRLEEARKKIENTRGYSAESREIRMLADIVREKIAHEDTDRSALWFK